MKKGYLVVGLVLFSMMLSACGGGILAEMRQKSATEALTATSYGIRSHDRTILIDMYAPTKISYNGLDLALSHALITEMHQRLAAQSDKYDVPEQLPSDRLARDKSDEGTVLSLMVNAAINDLDKKIIISLYPLLKDRDAFVLYINKNKYPKKATMTTTCEGMKAEQCSRALAVEAVDIIMPEFEKFKRDFLK